MPDSEAAREFINSHSVIRSSELAKFGWITRNLYPLIARGELVRLENTLYLNPNYPITEHHSLVQAHVRTSCTICLLSALRFHDIGTASPPDVWVAIDRTRRLGNSSSLPLHFVQFSGELFTEGVEYHPCEGRTIPVYSPAKTIADCFRHRARIGLDIFLEALTDVARRNLATFDDIAHYAALGKRSCLTTIRPYLESAACGE